MEHKTIDSVKEQLKAEMAIKTEVVTAVTSTVYSDSDINLNNLKHEPGLEQCVKSEPALLVKEEILMDSSQDGNEQQCVKGTLTPADAGSGNEACGTCVDALLPSKQELEDIDIGATVLQHMDIHYTMNQQNMSAVIQENAIVDDCNEAMPDDGVKKESAEEKLIASITPQKATMNKRSTCSTLQNPQLPVLWDHLEFICWVHLMRLDTFHCELCNAVYAEKRRLILHLKSVHESNLQSSLFVKFRKANKDQSTTGSITCQKVTMNERCSTLQNPQLAVHRDRLESICRVPLIRLDTFQCELCNAAYTEKRWLLQHLKSVHGSSLQTSLFVKFHKANKHQSAADNQIKAGKGQTTMRVNYNKVHLTSCLRHQKELQQRHHRASSSNSFKCDSCDRTFHKPHLLRAHKKLHMQHSKIPMTTSSTVTDRSNASRDETAKAKRKRFKCDVCVKKFSSKSSLNAHKRLHTGVGLSVCHLCDAKFITKNHLKNHLFTHTGEKPNLCTTCGARFARSHHLTTHMRVHTGEKPYQCTTCDARYAQSGDLIKHLRVHTGEKPYECTTCDARFVARGALTTHMRVHTGEKPYQCITCDARFAQSGDLTQHMRVHTGEKPYQCSTCDAAFACSGDLTKHLRIHTGEKPYRCNICHARFAQSGDLTKHMRIHTGEKPYLCTTCDARFTQNSALTTHIRIHTGEKPYKCTTCDARFSDSGTLTKHMRVHTGEKPYKCTTCEARFAGRGALTKHMRVHTGEKPYKCITCDVRFADSSALTKHLRVHTGEKPYQCTTCDARFARSDALTSHMRVHTGKNHKNTHWQKAHDSSSGRKALPVSHV